MAGRGPAPKSAGSRARRNHSTETIVPFEPCPQPPLPGNTIPWPDATVEWWRQWGESARGEQFTFSDWAFLLDTALAHADLWGNLNLDRLAELRLRVAKFGATPEDRARLRITFADADEKDAKRPAPKQTPAAKKFGHLKAV